MIAFRRLILLAIGLWLGGWFQPVVAADAAVVGVNLVNEPYKLPPDQQESLLATMQSAGVRAIRASIPDDANGLAFAQRVYAHGMQISWLVYPVTRAGTPFPRAPAGFEGMWRSPGLSTADPVRFRELFTKELADLEERGIKLAGLEFGNEINWVGSNADFPLPGKGRIFGLQDLYDDPEAKTIAAGRVSTGQRRSSLRGWPSATPRRAVRGTPRWTASASMQRCNSSGRTASTIWSTHTVCIPIRQPIVLGRPTRRLTVSRGSSTSFSRNAGRAGAASRAGSRNGGLPRRGMVAPRMIRPV